MPQDLVVYKLPFDVNPPAEVGQVGYALGEAENNDLRDSKPSPHHLSEASI